MRTVLALALALFATVATAQVCDVTLTTELLYKDKVEATNALNYPALDRALFDSLNARLINVVKVGLRNDEKGGDYTMRLGGKTVCDGKTLDLQPANVEFRGMKIKGVTRLIRSNIDDGDVFLLKHGDSAAKRGKRKAWGKD